MGEQVRLGDVIVSCMRGGFGQDRGEGFQVLEESWDGGGVEVNVEGGKRWDCGGHDSWKAAWDKWMVCGGVSCLMGGNMRNFED